MRRRPRAVESFEDRWARASGAEGRERASLVEGLDGDWKVERLSGPVPMPGVYKQVRGGRGRTWARWSPFPDLPFRLEQGEGSVGLIYRSPFSGIRDELRREADGSWLGRATVADRRYAWFRMVPTGDRGDMTR